MSTINLGNKVKDIVSGFTGIAVSRLEYITGCVQYGIQKDVDKSGAIPDVVYFDEKRIVIAGKGVNVRTKQTGGVMRDAPKKAFR